MSSKRQLVAMSALACTVPIVGAEFSEGNVSIIFFYCYIQKDPARDKEIFRNLKEYLHLT
jgi:hypothetical protein